MTWTRIDEYRAEARQRYGKLTPWRLGYVIGEDDEIMAPPYDSPSSRRLFMNGLAAGQEARQRHDELEAQGGTG